MTHAGHPDHDRDRKWRWTARLGVPLVRMLGRSWRIRVVNDAGVVALRRAKDPIVFALWHGDMLPLLYQHRDEGVSVLISEHRDGELIARVAVSLGFRTVRGSTSRGASRALVGLSRELEAGRDVAITPDGPRGPARSFAPVIAVGVSVKKAWRLRTWDRFLIPKAFARVSIAYSDPMQVESTSPRAAAAETSRFQSLMLDVERLADA